MDERTDEVNAAGDGAAQDEDAAQIRAGIEQTRVEMSETIDAIQEKLDPQRLKDQAVEKVHDATIGRAQTLAENAKAKAAAIGERIGDAPTPQAKGEVVLDLIKRHPLPAALLALLLFALARKIFGGKSQQETQVNEYHIRPQRQRDWSA